MPWRLARPRERSERHRPEASVQHHHSDRPDATFAVDRVVRGTTQIVTVRGDIDIGAGHAVSAVIDRAIGLLPDRVVIDLTATTFTDSAGAECLVRAQRHANARSVDLVVIPEPAALQNVRSTKERVQRRVAAARRAATYLTGEADHFKTLSDRLLEADRQMRRRLQNARRTERFAP
jgi:anti-anti-sigma factor